MSRRPGRNKQRFCLLTRTFFLCPRPTPCFVQYTFECTFGACKAFARRIVTIKKKFIHLTMIITSKRARKQSNRELPKNKVQVVVAQGLLSGSFAPRVSQLAASTLLPIDTSIDARQNMKKKKFNYSLESRSEGSDRSFRILYKQYEDAIPRAANRGLN